MMSTIVAIVNLAKGVQEYLNPFIRRMEAFAKSPAYKWVFVAENEECSNKDIVEILRMF